MGYLQDVRDAWRLLRRATWLNAVIVTVLAVGLAATVTMFSVVRAVVLEPLAFADSNRLITIETHMSGPDIAGGFSSYPDFLDWRARAHTIDRMAAYAAGTVNLSGRGEPAIVQVGFVSDDLLPMLGAPIVAGGLFPEGADRNALPLVVLAERFWRAKLGSDPAIVGHALTLDDHAYTVAGIVGAAFQFPVQPDPIDAWIPLGSHSSTAQYKQKRGAGFLHVVGRLRQEISIAAARSDLDAIVKQLVKEYPLSNANRTVVVEPMREDLIRSYRLQLLLLLAASGAVLLTACANVAHLLVTRALARRRELAIRAALGASRLRIARQLLIESLLLSSAAGVGGTAAAWYGLTLIRTKLPMSVPRLEHARLDPMTLMVAAVATLATGLLFGAAPAIRHSGANGADALRDARGSSGRAVPLRLVVIAEVAVSLVLLATAGLLTRSLIALQHVDPGFRPDHLALAQLSLPDTRYPDATSQATFERRLIERLAAMPGITSVGAATTAPLSGADLGAAFKIDGRPVLNPPGYSVAPYYSADPGFFATLGIPLLRGRLFTAADTADAPTVAIVSDSLARKYFPNEDAVGKRITLGFGKPALREIVGVVGDVKQRELGQAMQPQFYTPYAQVPWPFLSVVVRSAGAPSIAQNALRRAIAEIDPNEPPGEILAMDEYVGRSTAAPSLTAMVIAMFAVVAALLAAIGIYGVMAHAVMRRRRELGIRLALGAQPSALGAMVVREAMTLCVIGVIAGLAGALAVSRLVRGLLFGVTAGDPFTFAAVGAGVAVVMLAATLPPAFRSARADPLEAMRAE